MSDFSSGRELVSSRLVSSSLALGSVLTAWSLEPALDSVSPSLSLSAPPQLVLASSLSKINIKKKKKKNLMRSNT